MKNGNQNLTYPLWSQMNSIWYHSSLLCWLCTLHSQAPLAPGPLSTKGNSQLVCVYTIHHHQNSLWWFFHPLLYYYFHLHLCLTGLLACYMPDFLERNSDNTIRWSLICQYYRLIFNGWRPSIIFVPNNSAKNSVKENSRLRPNAWTYLNMGGRNFHWYTEMPLNLVKIACWHKYPKWKSFVPLGCYNDDKLRLQFISL